MILIFSKEDKFLLVKIYKSYLNNIDIYDREQVMELFKEVFIKIKDKYKLCGLFDVDVYVNDNYGMIIEINNLYFYKEEFDIKVRFHLDCIFLMEITSEEILDYEDVYYYKDKFYSFYNENRDREAIYKEVNDIINYGIKVC